MPRLLPLLEGLRVVSARALFERQFPGDPVMWKKAAFRELLAEELRMLGGQKRTFVLSRLAISFRKLVWSFSEGPSWLQTWPHGADERDPERESQHVASGPQIEHLGLRLER